ncbi:MAG TPA: peptidase domain-containing ABC transporter [Bacteroidales bacterium]|nr:peptidase domain-containing ABC transporter [Bacteroidales bacterium]
MSVKIKQRDITDCGAACLASVSAFYNLKIPVARIRQYASTDKKGTNILGLVEAAGKIGFLAKGVRGEWASLFKIPTPSIAHVVVNKVLHHYVVLLKATDKYIEIMDPAEGEIKKVSHDDFRSQWTGVLVILTPGEKFNVQSSEVSLQSRFWRLIKPNTGILIQTLAGALVFSILGLASSIYIGKVVDNVLPNGSLSLLNLLGIVMILITLFRLAMNYFQSIFILKTGQKIDATLILGYYQHILKLPQMFFDNMRTGEIISRINDAVKIRVFINEFTISFVLNIFILIVSFAVMFTFYWKLAVVMICVIPFYILIYFFYNKFNKTVQRRVMERAADLEAQLVESLNSAGTIKRFGIEHYANIRTETRFVALLERIYKSGLNGIFSNVSSSLITQIVTILLLWIGAGYVLESQVTPGELMSFYSVLGYFTAPVQSIIGFNRTLQDARIAADRLFEIFDLEIEDDTNKVAFMPEMTGNIKFDKVKFRYGTRVDVFDSFDIEIKRGEITAVIGESGSGKTTLVSLVQNLYPLQGGHIRIGNYDVRNIDNASLRKLISVVPQKIELFSGNVIENIALGDFAPDIARIVDICGKLGMTEFIEQLPNGYNTWLGQNGASLSGGQQQRIAIARALYRNPEILILDEATSSLDSTSESYVHGTLSILRKENKTVILIAHRLSTLKVADRIIVLEKGKVVQDGSFAKLSASEGVFISMWKQQSIELEN